MTDRPLDTIAVGFDGSPDAQAAARWAFALASRTGARVVLVHAAGLLEHLEQPRVTDELQSLVMTWAAASGVDDARVRWLTVDGDACSVLLRVGDAPVAADLLVVGSRGHGAHTGLLLGSTSLQLAERVTGPLVIVPSARPDWTPQGSVAPIARHHGIVVPPKDRG